MTKHHNIVVSRYPGSVLLCDMLTYDMLPGNSLYQNFEGLVDQVVSGSLSTGSIGDKDYCEWRGVVTICYSRNTPVASGEFISNTILKQQKQDSRHYSIYICSKSILNPKLKSLVLSP